MVHTNVSSRLTEPDTPALVNGADPRDGLVSSRSKDTLRLLVASQAKALGDDHASSIEAAGHLFNAVRQSAINHASVASTSFVFGR
jgi:hypothetical protein